MSALLFKFDAVDQRAHAVRDVYAELVSVLQHAAWLGSPSDAWWSPAILVLSVVRLWLLFAPTAVRSVSRSRERRGGRGMKRLWEAGRVHGSPLMC